MRARAEARRALATESGFFTGRALSEIYLGRADAMTDDAEGGIARMRDHMSELKVTGSEYISDRYFTFIANALGRLGRFDEGLRVVDESFPFIERSGQRYYEAELHRLKGEMLLGQDSSNAAQAEQSFRTAIEISRKQHAKSWELRAITSLARLLAKQHKRDEARMMLAEIYNWFTEGFDTPDLKDAEALLEELGGQVSKLNRGKGVDGVPESSKNAASRAESVLAVLVRAETGLRGCHVSIALVRPESGIRQAVQRAVPCELRRCGTGAPGGLAERAAKLPRADFAARSISAQHVPRHGASVRD